MTLRSSKSECLRTWTRIVGIYTRCQLTKEADKLIAISAIAREMKPIMGCRYLAGLWERNLVDQLEWRIDRGDRSRPATYRAPSWSWASVEGYCSPNDSSEPMKHLIEIHSAHIDLAADDEMGQVKGGYLDVSGQLFVVDWSLRRSDETFHHYPEFSVSCDTWPDCSLENINEPLHLLPLTVSDSEWEVHIVGLILQQCGHQACYQRVGCTEIHRFPNRFVAIPDGGISDEGPFFNLLKVFGEVMREDRSRAFSMNDSQMEHIRLV